jgi:predicted nucleic acid-binding protein
MIASFGIRIAFDDAAYIVLAEKLGAALVTRDARLASDSGHVAPVEVF